MFPSLSAKYFSFVPGITFFVICAGCTQTLPNAQVCADKGRLGAKCAYTRNGPESSKSKVAWDQMRVGWFCLNGNDYGKYQKFISDTCARDQRCVDEVDHFVGKLKGK